MVDSRFKINNIDGKIIIEKDNKKITINQAVDDDIWITTSKENLELDINNRSQDFLEWQIYVVFESLMKSIIGRYILTGNDKNEYSMLPEDFIDLNNKVITLHSDGSVDNIFKLVYCDGFIKIIISKNKEAISSCSNSVRIRKSGSSYGYYYQEFLQFYRILCDLEHSLNKDLEPKENQKRLNLFKIKKK